MSDKDASNGETAAEAPAGATGGDAPAGSAQPLPLFYKAPRPIHAGRHARFGVRKSADMGFAAETNIIPVGLGEFATAAKFYPIVFGAEAPHMPVIICGMRNGQNAFVTDRKDWAEHCYVPAYVRRYPFIFMEMNEPNQMILCVDEESGLVSEGGDLPFFDADGKQTETIDQALQFCRMYHQQHQATQKFVEALTEHGLLTENKTEIRVGDNRRIELKGYLIVDVAKFDALDAEIFLDWRKRGWLAPIYFHMQSGTSWPYLVQQSIARARERAGDGDRTGAPAKKADD